MITVYQPDALCRLRGMYGVADTHEIPFRQVITPTSLPARARKCGRRRSNTTGNKVNRLKCNFRMEPDHRLNHDDTAFATAADSTFPGTQEDLTQGLVRRTPARTHASIRSACGNTTGCSDAAGRSRRGWSPTPLGTPFRQAAALPGQPHTSVGLPGLSWSWLRCPACTCRWRRE